MWCEKNRDHKQEDFNINSLNNIKLNLELPKETMCRSVLLLILWWMCDLWYNCICCLNKSETILNETCRMNSLVTRTLLIWHVQNVCWFSSNQTTTWYVFSSISTFLCCPLMHLSVSFKLARQRLCFDLGQTKIIKMSLQHPLCEVFEFFSCVFHLQTALENAYRSRRNEWVAC